LLALALATYIVRTFSVEALSAKVGGGSIDSIKNILTKDDIRNIALYSWFFTFLMTVQWIAAIPIIENYSELSPERIRLFALIEQIVSPLTLIVQLTLTYYVISKFGIKFILIVYGILFVVVFSLYGLFPSVAVVIICQTSLRMFEYGFNKPAREIAYSQLEKKDRYKTTVFIDTFITRFGDLSGSIFMGIGKSIFLPITFMPIAAIPFAILYSYLGWSITKQKRFKDL
jgi:AAA family ATP:ADP antiporter